MDTYSHLELVGERVSPDVVRPLRGPHLRPGQRREHVRERLHHPAHAGYQKDREVKEGLQIADFAEKRAEREERTEGREEGEKKS